ncbi:MAG TPA: hypothetical protein GXZ47_05915 [Treponema sp.]|nr:hypothetical protein [Treponema sp.]
MTSFFPNSTIITNDFLQCNNYWMFSIGQEGPDKGRLFFKPNTSVSGIPGKWMLYGKTGRPVDTFRRDLDMPLARIDIDNDMLVVITEGGFVYRVMETFEQNPDNFFWKKSWGWPFDNGPQLRIEPCVHSLSFSSAKEWSTAWTTDRDGNRHHRFIDHIYCLSDSDALIHFNDPWTPNDWAYAFPSPEKGRLLPARGKVTGYTSGINASGGVVGFMSPNGMWTIEYDFDIAGGNPFAKYIPHSLPHYEGIPPIVRFKKGAKPIRLPSEPWRCHGVLPGPCTAHLQVSPEWDKDGKVVPGPDARIFRILGLDRYPNAGFPPPAGGFWEKKLLDKEWKFIAWDGVSVDVLLENIINDTPVEYGPSLLSSWRGKGRGKANNLVVKLDEFGLNSNFFDPARISAQEGETRSEGAFYINVQMRTTIAVPGSSKATWRGVYIVYPDSKGSQSEPLRKLCHAKKGDRYARLFLRAEKDRIELIKPLIPLNADIVNWINNLFGKRIAVLKRV